MIVHSGYIRLQNSRYADKEYKAWFDLPGGLARVSKKRFRTEGKAIEYGRRVAERYNRLYAEHLSPIPCREGG